MRLHGYIISLRVMPERLAPWCCVLSAFLLVTGCRGLSSPQAQTATELEGSAEVPYEGFTVQGRHLYGPCEDRVLLRGVNVMVVWLDDDRDGMPAFREIAKTGANSVRIVWTTDVPPKHFEDALTNAVEHGLLPIIELHDATGEWGKLEAMVDYWVRPETVEVLRRHERHLIVNVANEAGDDQVTDDQFKQGYADAVSRMREAGIRTPILIDAAGWGTDADQLLRTAPRLMDRDPKSNLMFSVHWWHADNDKQHITRTLTRAVENGIPLLIGEFAHKKVGCEGQIAYNHLFEEAARLDVGWLAWSWGPGNSDCEGMDMTTDGTVKTLHGWGRKVAVTDSFSIKRTAVRPASLAEQECHSQ